MARRIASNPAPITPAANSNVATDSTAQGSGTGLPVSAGGSSVPDATTFIKGILKLAGDLGGTADLPTVPDLVGKVNLSTFTTKGDLILATAAATIARLGIGSDGQVFTADSTASTGAKWATPGAAGSPTVLFDKVAANQSTTSTTYVPLTTVGPQVTLSAGVNYLIIVGAFLFSTATNEFPVMSFDIGGTGAIDANGLLFSESTVFASVGGSCMTAVKLTNPGAVTLLAKYKSTAGGSCGFSNRFLAAIQIA